jgi:hypothetical protein
MARWLTALLAARASAPRLSAAIERAAVTAGTPYVTPKQLYYETCRLLTPKPLRFRMPTPLSYQRFAAALGDRPGLVGERPAFAAEPGEPDVFDYCLPRLLVCQHRDIASMLLANDLHLEAACPIVSAADLPLDPRLRPETVYVLHDASAAGLAFARSLTGFRLRRLGLRPAHAAAMHLPRAPRVPAVPIADHLRPWETRWLAAGNVVEISAINPARLVRTLHRLVREHRRGTPSAALRELAAVGFLSWPTERQAA